tara:strand:- start:182 stop:478 length:297 start_codon:yes stop_codon:yes gene_type:complete
MINFIFDSLKKLSLQTELLEACGWDDKRVEYVVESFTKAFKDISEDNSKFYPTIDSLRAEIDSKLDGTIENCEIVILLKIFDDNFNDFKLFEESKYDN